MSYPPRLGTIFDLHPQGHKMKPIICTPRFVTKRSKTPLPSPPAPFIDLTQSPGTSSTTDIPQDRESSSSMRHLDPSFHVNNRRLHSQRKRSQIKKKYDLAVELYTAEFGGMSSVQRLKNERKRWLQSTPKITKSSPTEKPTPEPLLTTMSPYTPENEVGPRPLRGYRLQDVLHKTPITPVNYYKSAFLRDST